MRRIFLLFISFFLTLTAHSQQERPDMCRSDEQMKKLYQKHPQIQKQAVEFEKFIRQQARKEVSARQGSYTVPVVFHVFGTNYAGKTVTDNTIITALQKVNEDFHGLNDDYNSVSSLFQELRATLDIQFKLAKLDPNGNPTTGINYYPARSGFGNGGGYDDQIQQYAWDNYKYMNVYIMLDLYGDNSYTNSGVAWYPDSWMSDNNLARVVYNGRYLYGNTGKEFASVLTHEFGHWLNLAHTFDNACNAPGDNVDDTPATTSNYGSCNVTQEKCAGAGIPNGENYMDYSDCYKMFTQGQVARMVAALSHPARQPLWQESNLAATGVNNSSTPFLLYSNSKLYEDDTNTGGIEGSVKIIAKNGAEFAVNGPLIQGTHFTISNVPSGLSAKISVQSSTSAILSFSGNAVVHGNTHDVSNISISFLNPAIVGGTSVIQNPTFNNFALDFKDPYSIVYKDIADITANQSATWTFFSLDFGNGRFGCWYDNGKLRLETYTKPLVCEGTTRNISILSSGQVIGTNSNWVDGGAYPDEHDLRSSTYQAWDGKSGYIGFRFNSPDGKNLHGWFRVTVNSDGTSFTLHDYAYYTKPNGSIKAGATVVEAPPVAAFTASSRTVTIGDSVSFTDQSTGNPAQWAWSFPGGTPSTSSLQNPMVTYNTPGTYNVELTASNASGSTTKVITGYMIVSAGNLTYCSSSSKRAKHEYIANVQVGDFSNPSGASNYSDFTDKIINLKKGLNKVTLTPGFTFRRYFEYFRVWIDYNQDGDFEDAGELAFDAGISPFAVTGLIYVPARALNGTTRMRVSMQYRKAPKACGSIGYGEVEDYTINIGTPLNAPASLNAKTTSTSSITLGWLDKSSNEDSFEIERSSNGSTFVVVASVEANSTSYTDIRLNSNTNYTYRVRARKGITFSAYSNNSNATTLTPPYCTASGSNPSGQHITNVKIGNINNNSTFATNGYSDYSSLSTVISSTATLNVTPHNSWAGTQAKAWIDWNNDGDFLDNGEEILSASGAASSYDATISAPTGLAAGTVKLRVRIAYNEAPTPCGNIYFSETEDYTLNINHITPTGPSASAMASELSLYPNPAKHGQFHLLFQPQENELNVSIYSLQGSLVYYHTISENEAKAGFTEIKLNKEVRGTYVVHLKSQSSTMVRKIVFE